MAFAHRTGISTQPVSARCARIRSDVCRAARAGPSGADIHASISSLLNAVAVGRVDVAEAAQSIEDISNGLRAVQPKVAPTKVLDAPGMPPQQLAAALQSIAPQQHTAAARNVDAATYAAVRSHLAGVKYHAGAQMLLYTPDQKAAPSIERLPGRVAIVCGFSSDLKPAFEAKVSLGLMGGYSTMYQGVSAADLPGVIQMRSTLESVDAVIVCCGEQPALAGLLSSLVAVPVIALPSAGSADPISAFNAAGVSAVAPDDGVAAAAAAARTLRVAAQYIQYRKEREDPAYNTTLAADEFSGEPDISTIADEEVVALPKEALPAHNSVSQVMPS